MKERQVIYYIVLAVLFVGLATITAALYSVARIQDELDRSGGFHTQALFHILSINAGVSEVIQESLAYALSGESAELDEYESQLSELTKMIAAFPVAARLNEPGEEIERSLFRDLNDQFSQLQLMGGQLISEYDTTGAVTGERFRLYEDATDAINATLARFVEVEEAEVEAAQANTLSVIVASEKRIVTVGLLTLLLAVVVAVLSTLLLRRLFAARDAAEREVRVIGQAVESAAVGIIFADARDPDLPLAYANSAFERITGYSSAEVVGQNCRFLQGQDTNQESVEKIRTALAAEEPVNLLIQNYRKNGDAFWNDLTISPVRDKSGQITHFVGVINDVTDRQSLEQRLMQSQKMDAVGQLAGGIAHDFNNYLTVISGAAGLIATGNGEDIEHWTKQIVDAGERTSALTHQLLAFARRQVMDPEDLDVNDALDSLSPFLRTTIGENISLVVIPDSEAGVIRMDPSQLEQIIINLAINARDAMPDGGTITIETGAVLLSAEYAASHPAVTAGPHTLLAISDTGTGIDPSVKHKIFDPFVTTKKPGEGTGLGLSTVYGILEQSGASIQVYSEVGHGTTFKIYFPNVASKRSIASREMPEAAIQGEGVVLLVEDDMMVRKVAAAMLKKLGFAVVPADDGVSGLKILRQRDDIRLLLTDITMPNMGGIELAKHAREVRPGIPILFMSGYTQNGIVHHGLVDPGHILMQKPFTSADLSRKLREALGLDE